MTPDQYSRPLKMNVLVACEYSGRVRDAFRARGHEAWSCDLLDPEIPESGLGHIYHLKGDVMRVLGGSIPRDMVNDSAYRDTPLIRRWDLIIAHPPCTYLTIAAEWAYKDVQTKKIKPGTLIGEERRQAREEALAFFRALWECDIPRICIENPIGVINTRITPPHQIIQPNQFGEDASKATCLWLKGLPPLVSTKQIPPRITADGRKRWGNQTDSGQNKLAPSKDRWKDRSRTYQGVADAMAEQWG